MKKQKTDYWKCQPTIILGFSIVRLSSKPSWVPSSFQGFKKKPRALETRDFFIRPTLNVQEKISRLMCHASPSPFELEIKAKHPQFSKIQTKPKPSRIQVVFSWMKNVTWPSPKLVIRKKKSWAFVAQVYFSRMRKVGQPSLNFFHE
jgi:hypothetical protein